MRTNSPTFVHLNCHSGYSLLEGALPLKKLVDLAAADDMPALGVTDTANLFGALEFSEKAAQAGVQPIIGCKLPVRFEPAQQEPSRGGQAKNDRGVAPLFLLVADAAGYRNLVRLVSWHYHAAERAEPIGLERLGEDAAGLIALTGGHDGPIYPLVADKNRALAEARLSSLKSIFDGRLYVGLERHGMELERRAEEGVAALAYEAHLPLVATNEPYFPANDAYEAHDALLAIAEGRVLAEDDRRRLTSDHGFLTQAMMAKRFADVPEALAHTIEISERCSYRPRPSAPILPRFVAGSGDAEADAREEAAELRRRAEEGLVQRLRRHGLAPGVDGEAYRARLAFEIGVIERMAYSGYFLIVADFIQWAKARGIPVGPGRGSGAGSLVAWALTITDLDPLRFQLLFERFLNPERVSMPDFDVDFCQERRDEVIGYVQSRYGADKVAQIITFGTLQARAALRDVGRVLEMPYGQVDRLCKMVPADPANPVTLKEAIASEPRLSEAGREEPIVARLLDIATRLEGLHRHASTHAAGIVIADRPLDQLVPLYRDPRSSLPVTQFNMKWVEQAGLVKFDFLGLKTLTVLQKAVELIRRNGRELDLDALPLDDSKPYAMLARGETVGVFQVESQGMRKALVGMKPDRIEDIIALVALYRPGPMDNIPTYNRRKHGDEEPDYLHPKLEPILKETYGVIIYQEQVMQIAQVLSGYSLGEADLLRRAMGKKIKAEMDAQRARFVTGAAERGVAKADAVTIFDLVAKFAGYGFNKSHAAAYALVAYQTAYLKANHPVEFLAASMTLEMSNTDKLHEFRLEARRLGIEVLKPDVNRSGCTFEVEEGRILYALCALKGVGTNAVEHICAVRDGKPFVNMADFARRIDPSIVNRKTLECLVQAGAFDALEPNRAKAFAAVPRLLTAAQERLQQQEGGVSDLFARPGSAPTLTLDDAEPWATADLLQREHAAIGAYLSAHPLDEYAALVAARRGTSWKAFSDDVRTRRTEAALLAGVVVGKQERRTKSGSRIGIVMFSDPSGQFEALVYPERLGEWRDALEPGRALLIHVAAELDGDGDNIRVRLMNIEPLEAAGEALEYRLRVVVSHEHALESLAGRLESKGRSTVVVLLPFASGKRGVEIRLPGHYTVTRSLAQRIGSMPGISRVDLEDGGAGPPVMARRSASQRFGVAQ